MLLCGRLHTINAMERTKNRVDDRLGTRGARDRAERLRTKAYAVSYVDMALSDYRAVIQDTATQEDSEIENEIAKWNYVSAIKVIYDLYPELFAQCYPSFGIDQYGGSDIFQIYPVANKIYKDGGMLHNQSSTNPEQLNEDADRLEEIAYALERDTPSADFLEEHDLGRPPFGGTSAPRELTVEHVEQLDTELVYVQRNIATLDGAFNNVVEKCISDRQRFTEDDRSQALGSFRAQVLSFQCIQYSPCNLGSPKLTEEDLLQFINDNATDESTEAILLLVENETLINDFITEIMRLKKLEHKLRLVLSQIMSGYAAVYDANPLPSS